LKRRSTHLGRALGVISAAALAATLFAGCGDDAPV
jgi:hypothetical protein